jgi:hypothetical protein
MANAQKYSEPAREVPVVAAVDVLVLGGGPAGLGAALAAARTGAETMLVERYGYLGGLATGGLVLFMDGVADKNGTRAIGGILWETLDRLRTMNGLAGSDEWSLHVDSEILKLVADEMCREASVSLRLHSLAVAPMMDGDRIRGAILESKSGRQAVSAKFCIDCTGDGDVAASAGAAFETGTRRIGLNLKIGGVDVEAFRRFEEEHPEKVRSLYAELRETGGFRLRAGPTPHSDKGVYWVNNGGLADRQGAGPDGDRERSLSGIDVDDLTFAEVELRRRMGISLEFYRKQIPGYENVHLLAIASQIGVRESRRIRGLYRLTQSDLTEAREFEDNIGAVAILWPEQGRYRVPYRSLVSSDIDGLLMAGRCISTDHWFQNLTRLIPASVMTGQAAGTAAALCVRDGFPAAKIDPGLLTDALRQAGVIFS